jgi:YegS/Rv2252/BmrU family lipid kinase
MARELAGEGDTERVLVVGGDGTIHEVANGILEAGPTPPALGIIPVGTGNDFFRMVGTSRRLEAALTIALQGERRLFDVGRINLDGEERYFVNLLGVGVDVAVLEKREGFQRLRGLPQYLAAFTSALVSFRPQAYRLLLRRGPDEGGEEVIEDRTILAAVTVGPSVGGGFFLNPDASPYDGELDLFFVEAIGVLKIARYIPRVIRGTHGDLPEVKLRRFTKGNLTRPDGRPFHFELDGERMPNQVTALEIDVCKGVLPVMVAGGSP